MRSYDDHVMTGHVIHKHSLVGTVDFNSLLNTGPVQVQFVS